MTVDARLSVIAQGGIRGVLEAHRALDAGGDVLLIDPDVDLAKVEDGLAPKAWILPAPSRR